MPSSCESVQESLDEADEVIQYYYNKVLVPLYAKKEAAEKRLDELDKMIAEGRVAEERPTRNLSMFMCAICGRRVTKEQVGDSVTLTCRIKDCRGAMLECHG